MTALSLHLQTEANKEATYEYLKTHKEVDIPTMTKDLGFSKNQVVHYLRYLTLHGHVTKVVRAARAKRVALYSIGRQPFIKKARPVNEIKEGEYKVPEAAKPYLRVHKLLDKKEQTPTTSTKSRHKHIGSMQSGMQLFSNW